MSERSPRKLKPADKDRIQHARKQIIQCESIIRKVLAIHNCFEELRNLDSESCLNVRLLCLGDGSIVNGSVVERQSPLRKKMDDNGYYNSTHMETWFLLEMITISVSPLKPASSHVSTPLFIRSSPSGSTPVVSRVKPVSSHIPTPVPVHGLSYLSTMSKRSSFSENISGYSPRPSRQAPTDIRKLYPEAALHTPTKRHTRAVFHIPVNHS